MTPDSTIKRGPGRPRDHSLDPRIRAATIDLLGQGGGPEAVTIDQVAARSGVGKATIYRRWRTKENLILDAVRAGLPLALDTDDHDGLDNDARALLVSLLQVLAGPHAHAARQLLPQLHTWPELTHAYRDGALTPWQDALDVVAGRALARGEVTDPGPVRTALHAAGTALMVTWLVSPTVGIDEQPGKDDRDQVDQLVYTLIRPLVQAITAAGEPTAQ